MTGLLNRIVTAVTGKAHDLVDAAEDAGSIARQTVRDISNDIDKANEARVTAQTEYNALQHHRDEAQKKVDEYTGYANDAVAAGDDSLATEALTKLDTFEAKVKEFQVQMDAFKPTLDGIASKIHDLEKRRDQMQNQTTMIEARDAVADARINVANVMSGLGEGANAGKTFDRISEATSRKEAEAAAREQIAAEKSPESDADKFAALKTKVGVADRLAALKAAQGK
jgi:phage shock protein A